METISFALLQAALIALLMWFFYDMREENPLYPATVIKHHRLDVAPSPRVIFVGGSNLLFGLDSGMIERETSFAPVNMGLIGGLRLEYMLNEALANVRAGDVVVLSIEYNALVIKPGESNLEIALGLAACRPANIAYLSWPQVRRVLDGEGVRTFGIMFRAALDNVGGREQTRRRRSREDRSVGNSINEYGDLTLYHPANARLPRNPNDQPTLPDVNPEFLEGNIRRMNEFIRDCERRDVRVAFAPPPVPRSEFDARRDAAMTFDHALDERLHAPMLMRAGDMVFDDDDFIGRSYHLHGDAVGRRTRLLIDAMQERFHDSSRASSRPADETTRPGEHH